MEQYASKNGSGTSTVTAATTSTTTTAAAATGTATTPKNGRTLANGYEQLLDKDVRLRTNILSHKHGSPQRRKNLPQPLPLLTSGNAMVNANNGHSDLESGDENHQSTSNGFGSEPFLR
jgi:hypothetical protein